MTSKKVLFLLDNPFTNDRRVQREAQTLVKAGFQVTLIAVKQSGLLDEEIIDGIRVIRIFDKSIFDIKNRRAHYDFASLIIQRVPNFSIIHAHDHTMLSIACEIKKRKSNSILIYDSHELFSSWPLNVSNYNSWLILLKSYIVRKLQIFKERRNSEKVDYLITVNESLRSYLANDFKIPTDKTLSLRNIPEKTEVIASNNYLRTFFGINDNTPILVFIGSNIYAKTLNLEQVLEEFGDVESVAVVFICGLNENAKPIQQLVKDKGWKNVYFHDKVSPNEIPLILSSADVGLVPTWNKHELSYWYALDNKLFEYINARIPILATAQPEYKLILDEYGCGICVNPDINNAYLEGFKEIMNSYESFFQRTERAALRLTWENEEQQLIDYYNRIN